ncbi:MAG: hypothetical protein IPI83_14890 [Sphingomonadales bacterium]|nr:hypothetical protein [Sphingomonadales bacterium]
MNAIADPELAELCEVSARIGADPMLIQGPGGNTSFKSGDELWVKASGAWLAEALEGAHIRGRFVGQGSAYCDGGTDR